MGRRLANKIKWTSEMLADLATMGVGAFAEKHRISLSTVTAKRHDLGLSKPRAKFQRAVWTEAALADLPTMMNNRQLAEKHGLSVSAVVYRRAVSEIRRNITRTKIVWTDEMLADLARMSPADFAERYRIKYPTVISKRRVLGLRIYEKGRRILTDEEAALLGTASDREVAERLGASIESVKQWRMNRGIKSEHVRAMDENVAKVKAALADGPITIREAAEKSGVGYWVVSKIIKRCGIPHKPARRGRPLGSKMQLRDAMVVCLRAIGFSEGEIGKAMGVTRQMVSIRALRGQDQAAEVVAAAGGNGQKSLDSPGVPG